MQLLIEFRRGYQMCSWMYEQLRATLHGAWDSTPFLCKSNACSSPPGHLSNLQKRTLAPQTVLKTWALVHPSISLVHLYSLRADSHVNTCRNCSPKAQASLLIRFQIAFNSCFMHVSVLPVCMSVHLPYGYGAHRGQKRTLDVLKLGF